MAADSYQYSPLDAQEPSFRLLRLRKGDTVKVECEIFHSQISGHCTIPYEALSYTWGCTDLVDQIEVDGRRLWITANLYSALLCLRSAERDRILWIDAICINQSDTVERSQQVQQMGSIFGSAERVIIWLGKPTPDILLLMDSLSEFERLSTPLFETTPTVDDGSLRRLWSSLHPENESHTTKRIAQYRRSLLNLLKRPWFERVWILQEVANAKSAIVCCGSISIEARIFAVSPLLLDADVGPYIQSLLDIFPQPSREDSWWGQNRQLFYLLDKFWGSKATDERDKIFALLAMSSEPCENILLRPDYTKSIEQVLQGIVRYWFEATSVAISQILDLLASFTDIPLRITYFVPDEETGFPQEIFERSRSTLRCVRDASLLVIEQSTESPFHNEAVHMQKWFRVFEYSPSITFYYVEPRVNLLNECIYNDSMQIFDMVLDQCTGAKQKGLDDALSRTFSIQLHGFGNSDDEEWCWKAAKVLLARGANVNANANAGTAEEGTVLWAACRFGYFIVVLTLLENGADVNMGRDGRDSALEVACRFDHYEIVQMLIIHCADAHAPGRVWLNALSTSYQFGSKGVVQKLLGIGVEDNTSQGKMTPLQAACERGLVSRVEEFLDDDADEDMLYGRYGNELQIACRYNHEHVVRTLLEHGADVNAQGGEHGSALRAACWWGRASIAHMLLDHGAIWDAQESEYDELLPPKVLPVRNVIEKILLERTRR